MGKAQRAPLGARPARPPEGRRADAHAERMCIGKKREEVEKGRDVLGGAQGHVLGDAQGEEAKGGRACERRM